MEYCIVYVVMHEGVVQYVSTDEDSAEGYAISQSLNAGQAVLDEWDIDDPTEDDIAEAGFQAGFDGGDYEIFELNISNLAKDDMVKLPDGDEVEMSYILEKLEADEQHIIISQIPIYQAPYPFTTKQKRHSSKPCRHIFIHSNCSQIH